MKRQHIPWLIILIALFTSLFLGGCFENSLTFLVQFQEVSGLKKGDPIYFETNKIGQVDKVTYTKQGDYLVEVTIAPEFKNTATEDSKFYIDHAPKDDSSMAITVEQERPGGVTLKKGAIVQGSTRVGFLNDIFKNLKEKAGKAEKKLNKTLDEMNTSLDKASGKMNRKLETTRDNLSSQIDSFRNELEKIPDSKQVRKLEENIQQFLNEFHKAHKDVQDRLRNEIIPKLRMEMEHLRKQLKNEGREEEMEKIDKQEKELIRV